MSIKRETAEERKALPLATGVLDYFPDALLAVAEVSRVGNDQHNPGQPLHWAKEKSTDEADALMRHLIDRGSFDSDGTRHTAKVAWRALALLQRELDAEAEADRVVGRLMTANRITSFSASMKDCGDPACLPCTMDRPFLTYDPLSADACSFCGVTHGEHVLSCPNYI